MASSLASMVVGVDAEKATAEHWGTVVYGEIDAVKECDFDLITAFHVIEHLPDPVGVLEQLGQKLAKSGRLIIEVPSAEDALLSLYDSEAFQRFTYWSQHLYLFNCNNLRVLAEKAGFRVVAISQFQRYPLSNHLYWLSKGEAGGHQKWSFLDNPLLAAAYSKALSDIGKCDTLIAHLELE
nr:class I SAM-dependent methyltransferase [Chlorobium phaeovibrioides]